MASVAHIPAQRSVADELTARRTAPMVRLTEDVVQDMTPVVFAVVRGQVSSTELAEDIVQDTWLIVLEKLHTFEHRSSLRTWVIGIALNVARSRVQRERRAVPVDPIEVEERLGAARDPLPEERAMAAELGRAIADALLTLPDRQRHVLRERDVVGRSSAEVCGDMGISAANQRILLHRARRTMRLSLSDFRVAEGAA